MEKKPRSWRIRLIRILLGVVLGLFGVILLLLLLERRFIFFPTTAETAWADPPAAIHAEDVYLPLSDNVVVHGWWCPTPGWKPDDGAMLYCHGNAGNLSFRGAGVQRWQERCGIAVFIIDYPGYGRSTGQPDEQACYATAEAAYHWLVQDRQIPAEKILLYGGSLGGGVAVEIATRHPHRGLILVSTFTSVPDVAAGTYSWLPVRALLRTRFDNLAKIGNCPKPVFIAHGTGDRVIPFHHGERLYQAAKEPKRFFPMPNLDHNHTPIPEFYTEFQQFLSGCEHGVK